MKVNREEKNKDKKANKNKLGNKETYKLYTVSSLFPSNKIMMEIMKKI